MSTAISQVQNLSLLQSIAEIGLISKGQIYYKDILLVGLYIQSSINFSNSAIHDQGTEDVCWAYAIATMLRASIRSALKKYSIKKGLEILDNSNHHKMMRKELTMNIFPFGKKGTDIKMVIKLVNLFRKSWL